MLTVISWIVFGLFVGIIAKAIMPGNDPGGFIVTTIIGIIGAVIGGFIGSMLFNYGMADDGSMAQPGFFVSLFLSVIGAIILLGGYRLLAGRTA